MLTLSIYDSFQFLRYRCFENKSYLKNWGVTHKTLFLCKHIDRGSTPFMKNETKLMYKMEKKVSVKISGDKIIMV